MWPSEYGWIVADFSLVWSATQTSVVGGRRGSVRSRMAYVGNIPIVKLPEPLLAVNHKTVWALSRGIRLVFVDDLKPVTLNRLARSGGRPHWRVAQCDVHRLIKLIGGGGIVGTTVTNTQPRNYHSRK